MKMIIDGKEVRLSDKVVDELESLRDLLYTQLDETLPSAYETPETLSNRFFELLLLKYDTAERCDECGIIMEEDDILIALEGLLFCSVPCTNKNHDISDGEFILAKDIGIKNV